MIKGRPTSHQKQQTRLKMTHIMAEPERQLPRAQEWDGDVKSTFYRLYVQEDKKLSQVMNEMAELLGFEATYETPQQKFFHALKY